MDPSPAKPSPTPPTPRARVVASQEAFVSIEIANGSVMKNEVGYICLGEERLMAEVLRVSGNTADMQVFEDTSRVKVGDPVELSGAMLSATLGPGLLGTVFDGLQNPLHEIASEHGFFLPRGAQLDRLDHARQWSFKPVATIGGTVVAGDVLGTVAEGFIEHKIMAPFDEREPMRVKSLHDGPADGGSTIAVLERKGGGDREVGLFSSWPVRRPIPEAMLQRRHAERLYPDELLSTTIRIVDTFYPIARGGMACIPGPFGAGKTVLQNLISRYSDVDVVVIVACGERAGEVVETITEFPELDDPKTGGSLMDRTILVCNTSAMPVAAREASIYTGITLGEYYQLMGYNVLLLADSTSRWAQAMRETSGRMEEIPGEEAFPAYLDSSIKNVYERAGVIRNRRGETGSMTIIGTVSPAGGNFEEPVTQATLGTVKTFLGLSADRAYRRFYPAIDPLISWSRYHDQLRDWLEENVEPGWGDKVARMQALLEQGDSIYQMMQVTGEEGITTEDFVTWQKSLLLDTVYLQQDAYDPVDVSNSLERQRASFDLVTGLIDCDYAFDDKEVAREFFTSLMNQFKNYNYSAPGSADFEKYKAAIEGLANGQGRERLPLAGESAS